MRRFSSLTLGFLVAACGGGDDSVGPTSDDSGVTDASTGDARAGDAANQTDAGGALPQHAANSIVMLDHDPAKGSVDGVVTIGKAANETDISTYDLYWGKSSGSKLTPIASLAKTGANLSYALTAAIPAGAESLVVLTSNASGEMATGTLTTTFDNYAHYTDISAGQGQHSGYSPSVAIDALNQKLLVVTMDDAAEDTPALFRTSLDGSGATYTNLTVSSAVLNGLIPVALVDTANQKLLAVTDNQSNSYKPALFRCGLDGSACEYTDISASRPANSAVNTLLTSVIDTTNLKLLTITEDGSNSDKPALFRCNLDGSSCTFADLSGGAAAESGFRPTALIDSVNHKLLVVTQDESNTLSQGVDIAALFRCNLDGTGCTYADVSGGPGQNSGLFPAPVIDTVNQKLLIVTTNGASSDKPGLSRCDLDGSNCAYVDISAAQGAESGYFPTALVDTANHTLVVVTTYGLFRCNLDGTSCKFADISAGLGSGAIDYCRAIIDAVNHRLLVIIENSTNEDRLGLISVGL